VAINKTPGFIRGFVIGIALVCVFFSIPYLPIGLKALGFMRYDFIPSTSGAVLESSAGLPYRFQIGSQLEDTKMQISMVFPDGAVGIIMKEQGKGDTREDAIATPAVLLPTDIRLSGSASAVSASPSGHIAYKEAFVELQAIQQSHATLSARIASLSAEIDTLLAEGQQVYSEVMQSKTKPGRMFDGPIETVRQDGQGLRVSYSRDGADIVETITITNPDIDSLVYEIESPQYGVVVHPTQAWDIVRSNSVEMHIVSRIKTGSDTPLPAVAEQQIFPSDTGHSIRFLLPKRTRTERGFEPLVVERRYIRKGIVQASVEERIQTFIGADEDIHPVVVAPFIDRIIPVASGAAILHDEKANRYTTSDDHIDVEPYFGGEPLTALSCRDDACVAVKNDMAIPFSLTDLKRASESAEFFGSLHGYQLKNPPIGDIALGWGNSLFYTSAQSPIGGVFRRDAGGQEERISDPLSFPLHLSVTSDGTGVAYWAEGKIHVSVKGTKGVTIPLDEEPIDLAIGPDYSVYCIMPVLSAQTRMIVRISLGLSVDVLPGKTGNFTAIAAETDGLHVAMTLSDLSVLVNIPWEKLEWIPLTWEEKS